MNKILWTLCLGLLIGCASPRYVLDHEKVTFREILDGIQNDQDKIKSLEGFSRVTIETEEFSGNFFSKIFYLKQDSLLLSLKGPFGVQVGSMFIGKSRFVFYNQFTNQFYNGSIEEFEKKNVLRIPVKLQELTQILIARENIPSMKILEYSIDDGEFFIKAKNGELLYSIWVDPASGRITRIETMENNEILYIKEYGDFMKIENVYFPQKIRLIRPAKKQAISVYYTQLEINKDIDPKNFVIDISDRAEQIDVTIQQMN